MLCPSTCSRTQLYMCSLPWREMLTYFELCNPRLIIRWLFLTEACSNVTYQLGKWHEMWHWTLFIPFLFAYDIYSSIPRNLLTCCLLLNLLYMAVTLTCICYLVLLARKTKWHRKLLFPLCQEITGFSLFVHSILSIA